jgi:hypothetical protein
MRGESPCTQVRAEMIARSQKGSLAINPINPRDELASSLSLRARIEHISLNSCPIFVRTSGIDCVFSSAGYDIFFRFLFWHFCPHAFRKREQNYD